MFIRTGSRFLAGFVPKSKVYRPKRFSGRLTRNAGTDEAVRVNQRTNRTNEHIPLLQAISGPATNAAT